MPLELGLASSHAPSMFAPLEQWKPIHAFLVGDVPQPPELAAETEDVLRGYIGRVREGFQALRGQLEAYRPEALVIVGDDQNEVFAPCFRPSMGVFVGDEVTGSLGIGFLGEPLDQNHVRLRCHAELASVLLDGLVRRGFDMAWLEELRPMSRPTGGIGHAFSRPAKAMGVPELDIPIVIVFINAYHPPLPSGRRCWQLGEAIRDIFDSRPERIALYGSGGLSHDPRGSRAGWVDEPLDRGVLRLLSEGRGEALTSMFDVDSDTLRSGTGEIRSWITVAGAFAGERATIVDYIPARHAVTGLGFAYWRPAESLAA